MANHKSALKRIRANEKRQIANKRIRTRMRTYIKKARTALDSGDAQAASTATHEAIIELDKATTKGVIHRNTAARTKSRLMKQLNNLG
ncbi:MAG: 30S ribosomal protein S20 [Anaerolineae bacterium]|nr:30S ribosomal protein S20 [Anaerolineae bacterium]